MITWLLLLVFVFWCRERGLRARYESSLAEFARDAAVVLRHHQQNWREK